MNLCFLLVFLVTQIFVHKNEAKTSKILETNKYNTANEIKPKLDPQVYKKTAELLHMINKINNGEKEDSVKSVNTRELQGYVDLKPIDVDYFGMGTNKRTALRSFMKMLQKNYDFNKVFDNLDVHYVRNHVISNPEVLELYKKNLRSKDRSTSSSSSDDDDYDDASDTRRVSLRDILRSLRRQAVFRIENPSSTEYKERISSEITENDVKVTKNLIRSMEDDQLQYTEYNLEKNVHNLDLDNRKREKANNEKEDVDNWDIITQKYDWEAKETVNDEDISILNDKQEINWDHTIKEMSKSTFSYWDENVSKKDKWQNEWSEKENEKDSFKKWDQSKMYKSGNGNKESINSDWNKWNSKVSENQNVGVIKNDWDVLPRKKTSKDSRNDVNNKRIRDNKKSWNERRKKVKIINVWDNVPNDLGKSGNRPDINRIRTTKRHWKKPDLKINEWDSFMTKGRRKPKKHEYIQRNGPDLTGFGRTPIPFIGRQGVYDDK